MTRAVIHLRALLEDGLLLLADLLRFNPVLRVEGFLFLAPPLRLVDGARHGFCNGVGVHDDAAVDIPRSTSRCLGQGTIGAQEAFFVGVHDGHQRNFGNVQALPQKVDADQHIKHAVPQFADDFDAVQCLHVGVDVPSGDAESVEVLGELFSHSLGQGGDQHAVTLLDGRADFSDEVVHLVGAGPHVNRRIEQARGADDLFDYDALGLLQFVIRRRGGDVDDLVGDGVEFIRLQWAVVQGRWQAKSVFHQ